MDSDSAIWADSLAKVYRSGGTEVVVFDGLMLDVRRGERLAIIGESGAGKSTLLHLLGGLDRPSRGKIFFRGRDIVALGEQELADFRNRQVGFVWQNPSLLPDFSALENVMMPLMIRGVEPAEASAAARERLTEVGLLARALHRAGELSGGEQQRVVLARALAAGPSVLLADEPTGSLDFKTSGMIMGLLDDLHAAHGLTSVFVTHNYSFAAHCDRVLQLRKGQLHSVSTRELQEAGVVLDATRLDGGTYV
ncbi:MAG TPA: ABC transporter ATP-binding protein [Bryobacteraceae bacterium]|nr:ABC transporter ATP-binding protein [Bryobacteraceae bacterium]